MNILHEYNLEHKHAVQKIREALTANAPHYSGLRLRCVAVRKEGAWHSAICVVQGIPKDSNPNPIRFDDREYGHVHLLELWMEDMEVISLADDIVKGEMSIGSHRLQFGERCQLRSEEFLQSLNHYSDYPGHLFKASGHNPQQFDYGPLIAPALPLYPDIYSAINHWMDFRVSYDVPDARIGGAYFWLPECRARIESIVAEKEHLILHFSIATPKPSGLRLKGVWKYQGEIEHFERDVDGPKVILERHARAQEFEIYLIDRDNTLYDYQRESVFGERGRRQVFGPALNHRKKDDVVGSAIQQGEGPTVEFKPYIEPGDAKKQEEVVETAIAFANTNGGHILIGVNNRCGVDGVEKEIAKAFRKGGMSSQEAQDDYIGQIRQWIAGAISEEVDIEINAVEHDSHTVIVVNVQVGTKRPYFHVRTNRISVRRGANNMMPDPIHELPALCESTNRLFDEPD